jgi:nucleoside 2-deoxyribosyltransferase
MRVYLAGPEVFLADREAIAAAKKAVCAAHGIVGVFPTDPAPGAPQADTDWMRIYLGNEAHIHGCDALIANLTPFRGASADPGTTYELGFMRALGRPVLGYSNASGNFTMRSLAQLQGTVQRRATGVWEDADGMEVEDFGLTDNLMIDGGITAAGGLLVVNPVEEAARWRDLGGFTRCVAHLVSLNSNKQS